MGDSSTGEQVLHPRHPTSHLRPLTGTNLVPGRMVETGNGWVGETGTGRRLPTAGDPGLREPRPLRPVVDLPPLTPPTTVR